MIHRTNRFLTAIILTFAVIAACEGTRDSYSDDPSPDGGDPAIVTPADTTGTDTPIDTTGSDTPADTSVIVTPPDTTHIVVPEDTTGKADEPDTTHTDPVVTEPKIDTMVLRIMDYNVGRLHKELDPTVCAPMIGSMIAEVDPDAVTLQELDSCKDGGRFQLRFLVSNTPGSWNYFFGSNLTYGVGGTYGIGVMMDKKYPVVKQFHTRLNKYDGAEVRGFCTMESEHFVVISTHLDHKSIDARQQQMLDINSKVRALYQNSGKLVILAGDFNGNQSGGVVINATSTGVWTRISSNDYTSTAKNPKNTIDHMFVLNNGVKYKIRAAKSLTTFKNGGNVKQASDHLPIMVELEFYYEHKD